MFAAVIPIQNEALYIKKVINTIMDTPVNIIIPVVNGSTDQSFSLLKRIKQARMIPLFFAEKLGVDVPRAIGAKIALKLKAQGVLFVDGDMSGEISDNLNDLIQGIRQGVDLALTDCYPDQESSELSPLASYLLEIRKRLNEQLGLSSLIGSASLSHGPHAISQRFLRTIPLCELTIPPVALVLAVKHKMVIRIATSISHNRLGSPEKDPVHCRRIAETIIGDCMEALSVYQGKKRTRSFCGTNYIGYHQERRWDILEAFLRKP